jgi:hypothetical protein
LSTQHNVRHRTKLKQHRQALLVPSSTVSFYSSAMIGFFLGFAFGVGCSLAIMYSIYNGGYRAAVDDAQLPAPPARLIKARKQAASKR